jgi:hypothetical protein
VCKPQERMTASPASSSWPSAGPAGITMEMVSPAVTCKRRDEPGEYQGEGSG